MPDILNHWTVMPHGPLIEVDDGILTVSGSVPMPLGDVPRRMTVVRLDDASTLVWSAIALSESEMRKIEQLGPPRYLIVPGITHRLDLKIWKERYPDIKIVTAPNALEFVAEIAPVHTTIDEFNDPSVAFFPVQGTDASEAALLVRRQNGTTLIVNDVIANVGHTAHLGDWFWAWLLGLGLGKPRIPRLVKLMLVADRQALARQFRQWAAIKDLRRIIVSHGDPIVGDPAQILLGLARELL